MLWQRNHSPTRQTSREVAADLLSEMSLAAADLESRERALRHLVRSIADTATRFGSVTVHEGSELHRRMVELTTEV